MRPVNEVVDSLGTTVFTVMSALCVEHDAINLGQGFPDEDGPEDVREAAARAAMEGPNQYPPMMGLPVLRQAIAAHNKRFYGLDVDWRSQVLVTSGATEALTASLLALLQPGDEVVLIEPVYDSYLPIVRLAGAVPRMVRLRPPEWSLPEAELRAAFGPKTKLLVLNSPMNPTGKVFDAAELALIAELARAHDSYVICDEVYEHLVFSGSRHVPLMTLPDMAERTLRIGSAGKTFSLTGWKVGYLTGAAALIGAVAKAHQFITFTTPPSLQAAVAHGLAKDDDYFRGLAAAMERKRDRLVTGLRGAGFRVLPSQGTYFANVDCRPLWNGGGDVDFAMTLVREARVGSIPVSAFYPGEPPTHMLRFCFCKQDAVLDEAIARLRAFSGAIG
ncbi:aminotransferase [Emcibacter sp. SYSU 3D8]|uniref:aminotransferase n=1 Tax=Emcibacter sp. SYSU 3D8 TaxID=3133969 RepID=UPI0031FE7D69